MNFKVRLSFHAAADVQWRKEIATNRIIVLQVQPSFRAAPRRGKIFREARLRDTLALPLYRRVTMLYIRYRVLSDEREERGEDRTRYTGKCKVSRRAKPEVRYLRN